MAQIYNTVSIVAFALAAVGLILAIVFWFVFKIPKVFGDLTGRNARRSMEKMMADNASGKSRTGVYNRSPIGMNKENLTEAIKNLEAAKELDNKHSVNATDMLATNKLNESDEGTEVLGTDKLERNSESTSLLNQEMYEEPIGDTTPLDNDEDNEVGATDVLNSVVSVTELLEDDTAKLNQEVSTSGFRIIQNDVVIHTNEIVE